MLKILALFSLVYIVQSNFVHGNRPPPNVPVCTVTLNNLYVNGYFVRELKDDEITEFNDYMSKCHDFESKMKVIQQRREKEDLHMLKIQHDINAKNQQPRFRRKAKFDNSPVEQFDDKHLMQSDVPKNTEEELPTPPEKPSFCPTNPDPPLVFGGMCMVLNNKVYIRDQPVRDLTEKEIAQVKEYQQKQQEYKEKWRQVMGLRMQFLGPQGGMGGGGGGMGGGPGGPGGPQGRMGGGMRGAFGGRFGAGPQRPQQGQDQQGQQQNGQGQMFDGMGMGGFGGGMGGPMLMDFMQPTEADLELPQEPEPPKICAVIY